MKLNQSEIATPLWVKLTDHYKPLLAKYRNRLEKPSITEQERISLCWKIAGIKEFFELATPERKKETGAE